MGERFTARVFPIFWDLNSQTTFQAATYVQDRVRNTVSNSYLISSTFRFRRVASFMSVRQLRRNFFRINYITMGAEAMGLSCTIAFILPLRQLIILLAAIESTLRIYHATGSLSKSLRGGKVALHLQTPASLQRKHHPLIHPRNQPICLFLQSRKLLRLRPVRRLRLCLTFH